MKYISFEKACEYDYGLFSAIAFPQCWQNVKSFEISNAGRADSGLMFMVNGKNTMVCGDEKICAESGQIVYLPQGAKYTAYFEVAKSNESKSGNITDYLINFTAKTSDGEPLALSPKILVISPKYGRNFYDMFAEAARKSENAIYSSSFIKAAVYEIITEVSKLIKNGEKENQAYLSIFSAIEYINENYLKTDIKTADLCELCHFSEATLRRMFLAGIGMAPKDYINSLKLKRAKMLLENGGNDIAETARLSGFEDPAYFSRFFKNHIGVTPSEYKNAKIGVKNKYLSEN